MHSNTGPRTFSHNPAPEVPQEPPRRVVAIALLRLTLNTIDDEGVPFQTQTWCTGLNEKLALAAWKRQNRALARLLDKVEVVTPSNQRPIAERGVWSARLPGQRPS